MPNQKARLFDGACTWGTVSYRMTGQPSFVHCCHCRWCQHETGSAFVVNAPPAETRAIPRVRLVKRIR